MDIKDFNKMHDIGKRRTLAMVDAYQFILDKENELFAKGRTGHDIVFIAEDIAVMFHRINPTWADAPFTYALKIDGEWKHSNSYYANHEIAYLAALGHKHLGANSSFEMFAARMLKKD